MVNSSTTDHRIIIEIPLYENIVITFILLFALLANGVLIFLFVRDRRMQTTTNFFVMSHIASEFFASCQGLLITIYAFTAGGQMDVSLSACLVIGFENLFFFYASFLSLTAIAVNRYLAVVKKIHHKITIEKTKLAITMIWSLSFVASLPWGTIFSGQLRTDHRFLAWLVYCDDSPGIMRGDWDPAAIFSMLWVVLCIGVPIIVLLICFRCIIKTALRNRRQVNVSYKLHHIAADAYARSAFTTLVIIAVYLVCNAFIIPLIIYPSSADSDFAGFIFRCIVWLRSATYPVVYTVRNPVYFRKLQQNCILLKSLGQCCGTCSYKEDNTTYRAAVVPRYTNTAVTRGSQRRTSSMQSANQQIRAWYERKPRLAFTDIENAPESSKKSSRNNNRDSPRVKWPSRCSRNSSCKVVRINIG